MWRICKAAGRPFPKISDDDVIDYMVMEAVTIKVRQEDAEQEEQQKKKEWQRDHKSLDQYR
jgi:hypothetical protein